MFWKYFILVIFCSRAFSTLSLPINEDESLIYTSKLQKLIEDLDEAQFQFTAKFNLQNSTKDFNGVLVINNYKNQYQMALNYTLDGSMGNRAFSTLWNQRFVWSNEADEIHCWIEEHNPDFMLQILDEVYDIVNGTETSDIDLINHGDVIKLSLPVNAIEIAFDANLDKEISANLQTVLISLENLGTLKLTEINFQLKFNFTYEDFHVPSECWNVPHTETSLLSIFDPIPNRKN